MGKVESELSPAQMLEWASKDFVMSETMSALVNTADTNDQGQTPYGTITSGIWISGSVNRSNNTYNIFGNFPLTISRFHNDGNRRIGYISGVNTDGSFNLYILGNGSFRIFPDKYVNTIAKFGMSGNMRLLPPSMDLYFPEHVSDFGNYVYDNSPNGTRWGYAFDNVNIGISVNDSFSHYPEWRDRGLTRESTNVLYNTMFINNQRETPDPYNQDITLTNETSTSIQIGKPVFCKYWNRSQSGWYYGDKNIGGDLFDLLNFMSSLCASSIANMPDSVAISALTSQGYAGTYESTMLPTYPPFEGSFAYNYVPYNLLLTYDLDAAKKYVEDGTLPADAFIYPFDVDNIPINEDGGTGADSSDPTQEDDPSGGDNSNGDDMEENQPEPPANTPQSLTNNNLYWLTKQQLKNFLDWFWEDATEIASVNDLWDKITGAYENLSQAIVAVRYMPVDPAWFGGVQVVNSMIVGMLEKEEQVQAISKTVAPVVDIGSTKPEELKKSLGRWINYSPYAQAYLYLPFFGYLDIDVDMVMNHELSVKATYDIMSGTIQYFILRDGTMINTVCAKMATDIPISLQTKTERDSAIFSNVSGVAATLIGGGVSAAAGNPIGMVMSTANLASMQPQGAPMVLKGNVSEAGAFYDCGRCIIFIKRPAVNIPDGYASHIGYPCNAFKQLSGVTGFFKCENPYIEFLGAKASGSDVYRPKPTAEEMDEIYNGLTEGLYMLDS